MNVIGIIFIWGNIWDSHWVKSGALKGLQFGLSCRLKCEPDTGYLDQRFDFYLLLAVTAARVRSEHWFTMLDSPLGNMVRSRCAPLGVGFVPEASNSEIMELRCF